MLAAGLSLLLTSAQAIPLPVDPKTYFSPSGRARLWVNPSERYGKGSARYRLSRSGKLSWQKTLPFTLRQVALTDEGAFGGYGYSSEGSKAGALVIAFVAPDGRQLRVERVPRELAGRLHYEPQPQCRGMVADPGGDRLTFRIFDYRVPGEREQWWVYRLSTGERIGQFEPVPPTGTSAKPWIVNAASVPGTPLTLVNWWRYDDSGMGSAYSLLNAKGKSIWQLALPGDYEGEKEERAKDRLRIEMQTRGAILGTSDRAFALKEFRRGEAVRYSVSAEGDGWKVTESAAGPISSSAPKSGQTAPAASIPLLPLPKPTQFQLPVEADLKSAVRDVGDFLFTPAGDFVIVRNSAKPSVLVVSRAGKLLKEIFLPNRRVFKSPSNFLAHVGESRYLFLRSDEGRNGSAEAFLVDVAKGTGQALTGFRSDAIEAAAGYRDGTFAVLTTHYSLHSLRRSIEYFAATGQHLWGVSEEGFSGRPSDLLSPVDIAFDHQGHLVVLDVARHALQRFSRQGQFLDITELDRIWKRPPSYPTHVARDNPDGLVLQDLDRIFHLAPDGSVRRSAVPKLNGLAVGSLADPHVDPKGQLWITNREAIFRLDALGRVISTLGQFSAAPGLRSIATVAVTPRGEILALDRLSGEVHAFDSAGKPVRVLRPRQGDFRSLPLNDAKLFLSLSGDVYVDYGDSSEGFLHFSPSGKRFGIVPWPDVKPRAVPATLPPSWWWWDGRLVDGTGTGVLALNRWPDQQWLENPQVRVSPRANLAVYEGSERHTGRLAFYSPTGRAERQVTVPAPLWRKHLGGYTGTYALFLRQRDVVVVDKAGKILGRVPLDGTPDSWQIVALANGFVAYNAQGQFRSYRFPASPF